MGRKSAKRIRNTLKKSEKIRNIQSEKIPEYDPNFIENENEILKEELLSIPISEQILSNEEMARLREGTKHIPLSSLIIMLPDFKYDDRIIAFCKNLVVPQLVCPVTAQIIASSAEHLKKPKRQTKSNKTDDKNGVKTPFFLKTKIPEEVDTLVDFYKNNKLNLDAPNRTKSANPEQVEHLKQIYDEFPERKQKRDKKNSTSKRVANESTSGSVKPRENDGKFLVQSSESPTSSDCANSSRNSESASSDALSTSDEVAKSNRIANSLNIDNSVTLRDKNSSTSNSSVINPTTQSSENQSIISQETDDSEGDDEDVIQIDPPANSEKPEASSSHSSKDMKTPMNGQKRGRSERV